MITGETYSSQEPGTSEPLTGDRLVLTEAQNESAQITELRRQTEQTRNRVLNEIVALGRRVMANLIIGILTTLLAIGVLTYIVLTADLNSTDWQTNIPNYLLRLSLAIFIEMFSFFFLRLYKIQPE